MRNILLALLLLSSPIPAWAESAVCVDKHEGREKLMAAGEIPIFIALSMRGHVTEIWMSPTRETWTAVYITPKNSKQMCVADAGTFARLILFNRNKKASYENSRD